MKSEGFLELVLVLAVCGLIAIGAYIGYRAQAQTVATPAPAAMVCAYSSSPPTTTDGTFVYLQCDSTGKIMVTP